MTITQTVDIPADGWLKIKIPREVTASKARVILQFPVKEAATPKKAAPPEIHIPKGSNGKFLLTKEILEEMERNSPTLHKIDGILSHLGDIDLDEIRMERLKKHL